MLVPPQSANVAVPVLGAVQTNHTSLVMPTWPKNVQMLSAWPSAPVVAAVLSKAKLPTPEIGSGVLQESLPFNARVVGTPRGLAWCVPPCVIGACCCAMLASFCCSSCASMRASFSASRCCSVSLRGASFAVGARDFHAACGAVALPVLSCW